MFTELDNEGRADRAQSALNHFATECGETDNATSTQIGDLLGDLMHLCNREDLDFETLATTAECHYNEEVEEENET